ncbi:PQQ-binding-like beta-propeller repeat protein [Blastopirellula sp. J2-11]|uniref:outer membrane protein assembly factor BamB family protein n=1 Tax=Blastopirellula sp. J2-11 TaxID=2943192 RepID=UPI0021C80C22|nr:PQQ-binding-like beta-propeller repeat protein [Blastopirellula sp. J2-11]UUO06987.1 PQQ-binding-like beta-propeller repeat protein [Blastopirellula sp. J2-11]
MRKRYFGQLAIYCSLVTVSAIFPTFVLAQAKPGQLLWTWVSPRGELHDQLGPVCTDGSLVFTTGRGSNVKTGALYALDLKSGNVVWETETSGTALRLANLCLSDDVLYVSTDRGDFYAIETRTGNSIWHVQMPFKSGMISVDGNDIFVHAGGRLFAIDARNGKGDWWLKQGNSYLADAPILLPGRVLVRDSNYAYCLNDQNRKLRWRAPASNAIDYSVYRNNVYACNRNKSSLSCYDLARGAEKWSQKTKYRLKTAVVPCLDWVVICSAYDDCRLVGVEARNGEEAWTIQLPVVLALTIDRMIAGQDRVYLQHIDQLYCVDPSQGVIDWQSPMPSAHLMECLWDDVIICRKQQRGLLSCYSLGNGNNGFWSQDGGGPQRGNYNREIP